MKNTADFFLAGLTGYIHSDCLPWAVLDVDNLPESSVYVAKASVGTCQWHVLQVEAKNNKVHEAEKNFTDSCIDDKESARYNCM